jgi:hypothetical protein
MHIYKTTSKRIGFNVKNILFGEVSTKDNLVINFIILYAKQYIFACLLQGKSPNILGLLNHLKTKYNVERCAYIHKSNLSIFEKQWNMWNKIFEPTVI